MSLPPLMTMNDPVDVVDALIATLASRYNDDVPGDGVTNHLLDLLAHARWSAWEYVVERLQQAAPAANLALLEAAHQRWPRRGDIAFLLGNHLRIRGQSARAEMVLRAAFIGNPADRNAGLSLSYLLREQGRLDEANRIVVDVWRHAPSRRGDDISALRLLCENHGHALAATLLPEVLPRHPDDAALHALAGEIALLLGRFDEATISLRNAVRLDPDAAPSWLRLAQTHRFSDPDDVDLQRLEQRHETAAPASATRIATGFALGKTRADLGDIATAATLLREANAAQRTNVSWSREGWTQLAADEARAPPLHAIEPADTAMPVFIVGLPRSGTTLTAHLLSRRGDVCNRGELNWIAAIAGRLGPSPELAALRHSAGMIMTQLRRDDAPASCYVDKNPLNFRHLRLIAAMLPNAKIINCRRDARDTALSIWSQHFAHADMGWAYDFDDIAAFDAGYRQLMATAPRLNLPTLDVRYEDLVTDTPTQLARIHAFLGLPSASPPPVDEAQAVATASVWQVRQPVHGHSVGRWQTWSPHLPELLQAFPD